MNRVTLTQAIQLTGCAKRTVCDWFNICREVCTKVIYGGVKLGGSADHLVQVDESYFFSEAKVSQRQSACIG